MADGTTREQVVVSRDDGGSTRWLLFRRRLPDLEDLAREVLVGARLGDEPGRPMVEPADGEPSAPFYLFFPTKIRSGLPFLLHGYSKSTPPAPISTRARPSGTKRFSMNSSS